MPDLKLYENQPRGDSEFPVELQKLNVPIETLTCPPHWHEQVEFHYIVQGNLSISCDQSDYHLKSGDFFAINPYEVHTAFCPKPTLVELIMVFDIHTFVRNFAEFKSHFQPLISNDAMIRDLFLSLFGEFESKKLGYYVAMKTKLYELLTYLIRNYMIENPQNYIAQKEKLLTD